MASGHPDATRTPPSGVKQSVGIMQLDGVSLAIFDCDSRAIRIPDELGWIASKRHPNATGGSSEEALL